MEKNKINQLSNSELESRLKNFAQQERKLLHVILEHIKEIETRRIYLSRAYPSMFEYLIKECGYSAAAAMRRLQAARLLSEIPELKTKIEDGTINLSQLGELSKALKEKQKVSTSNQSLADLPTTALALDKMNQIKINLVTAICGKSTSETQKILSQALDLPILKIEKQRHQKDDSVRLEITLSKEQLALLKNCRNLMAHKLGQKYLNSNFNNVIQLLCEAYLQKPKKTRSTIPTSAAEVKKLTPNVRSRILARDQCCQYYDPVTGRRCNSHYQLEVDHLKPRWANGDNSINNLQILCAAHNKHKYRQNANLQGR